MATTSYGLGYAGFHTTKNLNVSRWSQVQKKKRFYGHTLTLQTATLTPIEDTINESGVSELVRENIDM